MMSIDPILPSLVGVALVILLVGMMMRVLRQPTVIAYILVGVLLGPHMLGVVRDEILLTHLGGIGVMMLLFFAGMEVSLPALVSRWRTSVLGTLLQIAVSVGLVWLLGAWLGWSLERVLLLGFVISLSSTAVVFKLLHDWKEMKTKVGKDVVGVLLMQDVLIIPMLILLTFLGGHTPSLGEITAQVVGGLVIIGVLVFIIVRERIHLPLGKFIQKDHELQVFAALVLCLGMALLSGYAGLSTALGAFIAGIVVAAARETQWVHESAHPFRVVFVALFFVSIGMLIDLSFVRDHLGVIALLVLAAFLTNTFINAGVLRFLGSGWRDSLYAGSLLSQIGEFSFVLAAVGLQSNIITAFAYQMAIAVIALTLLISPFWIKGMKLLTVKKQATA